MSEWIDLMIEEVRRKQREAEEAKAEQERREAQAGEQAPRSETQSK